MTSSLLVRTESRPLLAGFCPSCPGPPLRRTNRQKSTHSRPLELSDVRPHGGGYAAEPDRRCFLDLKTDKHATI